jgi:hypothetical protein
MSSSDDDEFLASLPGGVSGSGSGRSSLFSRKRKSSELDFVDKALAEQREREARRVQHEKKLAADAKFHGEGLDSTLDDDGEESDEETVSSLATDSIFDWPQILPTPSAPNRKASEGGDLQTLYKCLGCKGQDLSDFLWMQLIPAKLSKCGLPCPDDICQWLLSLIAFSQDPSIAGGAYGNLESIFITHDSVKQRILECGFGTFGLELQGPPIETCWKPSAADFTRLFQAYGVSKMSSATAGAPTSPQRGSPTEFPLHNFTLVLQFFVLCCKSGLHSIKTEDVCHLFSLFSRFILDHRVYAARLQITGCLACVLDLEAEDESWEKTSKKLCGSVAPQESAVNQRHARWLLQAHHFPLTRRGQHLAATLALQVLPRLLGTLTKNPNTSGVGGGVGGGGNGNGDNSSSSSSCDGSGGPAGELLAILAQIYIHQTSTTEAEYQRMYTIVSLADIALQGLISQMYERQQVNRLLRELHRLEYSIKPELHIKHGMRLKDLCQVLSSKYKPFQRKEKEKKQSSMKAFAS